MRTLSPLLLLPLAALLAGCPLLPDLPGGGSGDWFRLRTEHHGERRCLESGDGIGGIYMATCGNYSGQFWQAVPVADEEGWFQLKSEFQGPDRCLTGNDPDAAEHFGAAYMVACTDAEDQRWRFVEDGGALRLETAFHGANECLDANSLGGEEHDGSGYMADCTSADTQRWVRVDGADPLELGLIRQEIVTNSAWLDGSTRPIDATCPVGKVVVGGGARWPGISTLVQEDRAADPRTWRMAAAVSNGGDGEVWAVCVDEASAPGYEIVEVSGAHPNGGASLEASCPDGKVAVGGGSRVDAVIGQTLGITLDNDRPDGERGWLIAGYTETGGQWTVQVLCVDAEAVPGREVVASTGNHPTGDDVRLDAACPAGKSVLSGGGYWVTGTSRTEFPIVLRSGDHPASDTAWRIQASSELGGEWWSQAVCATVE